MSWSRARPGASVVPTATAVPTSTFTLVPPTPTITPMPTVAPTPMGGTLLKVAFYASISNTNYLVVGDYFSGKIDHRIHVRNIKTLPNLSWSPDGAHILFVDPPVAATETENLKVNLLNVKTGQVTLRSTFPSSAGSQWNTLSKISWSSDNQYVLYSPQVDNTLSTQDHIAAIDGSMQIINGYYDDWLSDSKFLIDPRNGKTFNIETSQSDPFLASGLRKFEIVELTKDFMLLEPLDKVEGILYPQDLEDTSAWQYDALLNSKITLVAFSPEIQNPKIIFLELIVELPNHQLSVQGYGSFQVSDKTY